LHPRVTQLDLNVRPRRWLFAEQRRADIEAHFAVQQREKPIWNGRILLARDPDFSGGPFQRRLFRNRFCQLPGVARLGLPRQRCVQRLGMGALRCSDGAFILGEMGQHTANAGRSTSRRARPTSTTSGRARSICRGSVSREVEEETALTPAIIGPARTGIASSPALRSQ